jgi:two-component system sensor histidine kinase DegS
MPGGWPSQQGGPQPGDYAGGRPSETSARQPSVTSTWADVPPAPTPSGKRPNGDEQDDDGTAADALWDDNADLLAVGRSEYDQIARELDEIRMLIKQSTAELEKLNQRKVLAAAKTREMEEKIETYTRQEIRASYLASSEAEMRAFMISEQREQLQAKEKAFERYQRFLVRTINVLSSLPQGGAATGAWTANMPTWGPAPSQAPTQTAASKDQAVATLSRVIQAQEDVRQRVAQRLHDGPAQSLANVVLTAEICEKLIQSDLRRAQGELGNLKGLVNSTLQDTRKFIFELRPMTLDDLGLVPTLRRYIADVGARYQVQVTLVAPQGDQRLPHQMEVPIFRVAQEALVNAVQHGRATQARVTVALQPDTAVLVIEDNGTGFDVEQALAKAAARQTLGIASMQERAEMLGGWLRVESARGHGSRVELSVPVATS